LKKKSPRATIIFWVGEGAPSLWLPKKKRRGDRKKRTQKITVGGKFGLKIITSQREKGGLLKGDLARGNSFRSFTHTVTWGEKAEGTLVRGNHLKKHFELTGREDVWGKGRLWGEGRFKDS